jgi:negative regulator of flagellin synthesis FlgM
VKLRFSPVTVLKFWLRSADEAHVTGGDSMSYTNGIGDWKQASPAVASTSVSQTQQSGRPQTAEHKPAAGAQDEAKLSSTGELVARALSTPDVRTAKVEALQKAIADGSYNISSSDVAGKMIDSLLK